jgi:hypothetical protein
MSWKFNKKTSSDVLSNCGVECSDVELGYLEALVYSCRCNASVFLFYALKWGSLSAHEVTLKDAVPVQFEYGWSLQSIVLSSSSFCHLSKFI